jgi:Na+/proline symporter
MGEKKDGIGPGGWIFFTVILLFVGWLIFSALYDAYHESMTAALREKPLNEIVIYAVSWVVLLIISFAAMSQIREILRLRSENPLRRRADQIAIIAGLVLVIFLFKQPYLDALFKGQNTKGWVQAVLLGGGGVSGRLVWYLRQLKKYGEFFNIFLMTEVVGLSWYARLTAPEQVQLTAVEFLLGSLFRVAKDYMDAAASNESQMLGSVRQPGL